MGLLICVFNKNFSLNYSARKVHFRFLERVQNVRIRSFSNVQTFSVVFRLNFNFTVFYFKSTAR